MDVHELLKERGYRPAVVIDVCDEVARVTRIAVMVFQEIGDWRFCVPSDADLPYFVSNVSDPTAPRTLVRTREGAAYLGEPSDKIAATLKNAGYRHFINHGKKRARA